MLEAAGLEDDAMEILFTGQDKGIQGGQVQYFPPDRGLHDERHLEETSAVELRGRARAGGLRIDSMEVSLDGADNWSYAKLDKPIGKWAWVGWSFTWTDVTPGEYTLRCRAKDERGNMSKDDDSEHDYYAMDITKAQYVDVNVYPAGTLTPFNKIDLPVQCSSPRSEAGSWCRFRAPASAVLPRGLAWSAARGRGIVPILGVRNARLRSRWPDAVADVAAAKVVRV